MYLENLYQEAFASLSKKAKELYNEKALQHFNEMVGINIENGHTKKYADELIYCYLKKKHITDFDFWTQYEELLGEKISYDEYLAIDSNFDLDPHDVTPEDKETLEGWEKILDEYREENKQVASVKAYSLLTTTEDGDALREFYETNVSLDETIVKEAFEEQCMLNDHFINYGFSDKEDSYAESNYVDGRGFTKLEIKTSEIGFTRAQLKEFLKGIDMDILKEVLPEELRVDPLMAFIEEEVPYRMEAVNEIPLTESIKKELIESVQNDVEIFIDYDKFDMNLKNMHEDMAKKALSSYETAIGYLCEILNKVADGEFEDRTVEQFQPIFETDNYFGIYWYCDANEYYLVDKNDGSYQMVLGDSFEFVGQYLLECLESETVLNVANKEILEWLIEFSRENVKDILPEDKLEGIHVLENALIENIIDNALDLLKESYSGKSFDKWAEQEMFVSQSDKENVLYNALFLLEKRYEGNEDFVSWAKNELGVSSLLLEKIGFLEGGESVKTSTLDEKMANAKTRTNTADGNKTSRDIKSSELIK